MDYLISFSIGLAHNHHRPGRVTLDSQRDFEKLALSGLGTLSNPYLINVRASWHEPKLKQLCKHIGQITGRTAVDNLRYAVDHPQKCFAVDIQLNPTEEEFRAARWLWINSDRRMATSDRVNEDDSYVVRGVSAPRRTPAFGNAFSIATMALFNTPLKEQFMESGLKGFEFRSVKKVNGAESGLWQLWSPTIMPPETSCLLNPSYMPPVMRYGKNDVAHIPDFDVAFATGKPPLNNPGLGLYWPRRIIVSQRFREVAEELAPGQFKFGLVAVGEGEELKRRYTLPELAPPDEATD
jgi:hypothetical protein